MKLKIISLSCSIFLALPFSYAFGGMASFNHWKISKINVCFAEKETQYSRKIFTSATPYLSC